MLFHLAVHSTDRRMVTSTAFYAKERLQQLAWPDSKRAHQVVCILWSGPCLLGHFFPLSPLTTRERLDVNLVTSGYLQSSGGDQ